MNDEVSVSGDAGGQVHESGGLADELIVANVDGDWPFIIFVINEYVFINAVLHLLRVRRY